MELSGELNNKYFTISTKFGTNFTIQLDKANAPMASLMFANGVTLLFIGL